MYISQTRFTRSRMPKPSGPFKQDVDVDPQFSTNVGLPMAGHACGFRWKRVRNSSKTAPKWRENCQASVGLGDSDFGGRLCGRWPQSKDARVQAYSYTIRFNRDLQLPYLISFAKEITTLRLLTKRFICRVSEGLYCLYLSLHREIRVWRTCVQSYRGVITRHFRDQHISLFWAATIHLRHMCLFYQRL